MLLFSTMTKQKDKRGIGIKDIQSFNSNFLVKLALCFFHTHNALWVRILLDLYLINSFFFFWNVQATQAS